MPTETYTFEEVEEIFERHVFDMGSIYACGRGHCWSKAPAIVVGAEKEEEEEEEVMVFSIMMEGDVGRRLKDP